MTTPEPVVAVQGLAKRYGKRTVIAGVTLTLRPGDLVGLVGANGGGKTTTLRMLAGLLRPDAGSGHVLGEDIREPGPAARHRTGYMTQRLALYPELTARENLRFRADAHGIGGERTDAATARFGLAPVLDTRCDQLSGGWARRVQFAASVLHAPALLLLDEPTAGLDIVTRRDIWRWLGEFAAAGTAIVIATHDLVEAAACPVIMHFHSGRAEPAMTPQAFVTGHDATDLEDAVARLATL